MCNISVKKFKNIITPWTSLSSHLKKVHQQVGADNIKKYNKLTEQKQFDLVKAKFEQELGGMMNDKRLTGNAILDQSFIQLALY